MSLKIDIGNDSPNIKLGDSSPEIGVGLSELNIALGADGNYKEDGVDKILIGDTVNFTCISSGNVASEVNMSIFDGAETLVSSKSAVDSGNSEHWYAKEYFDPSCYTADAFYNVRFDSTISGSNYRRHLKIKVVKDGVD